MSTPTARFSEYVEKVKREAERSIACVLKTSSTYDAKTATALCEKVSGVCAEALGALALPFKFVASASAHPKKEKSATYHHAAAAVWNDVSDGQVTIRWENDSFSVVLQVFALSI